MMWRKVKLGDIAEFSNGINFNKDAYSKGVKLISVSNFGNRFSPEYDSLDEVKEEVVRNNDLLSTGDIVFVRSNGNKELVGRCMFIDNPPENVTYSGFCIRARFKDTTNHDPVFWTYHFKNRAFRRAMSGTAIGANIQNLSQGRLTAYETTVPDVEEQKKIAKVLSSYDNLIENNQKQIKLLEEAAQRLYKEWFVDLRFPGYEDVAIVDGVPDGWKQKSLSEIFTYIRGKSYTSKELVKNGGTLMVNLKNIRAFGGYNRNAEKRYSGKYKEEQELNAGDLIMGVTDMTQERRLVGHVAIVPDNGETMTFSMDLIKLIPLSLKKSFLYATMYFGGYSKKISQLANGVNVLHLKPEAMMNMEMLIPTEEIISQYDEIFEAYQNRIEILQKQCNFAIEARDRLLPKLMSGEIEV